MQDYYGFSVDIEGDVAIVGAWNYLSGGRYGAAFTYGRNQGARTTGARSDSYYGGNANGQFGYSVAIGSGIRVIGEPGAGAGTGVVYIRNATLNLGIVDPTTPGDHFGTAVDIDGDVIAVTGSNIGSRIRLLWRNEGGADQWGVAVHLDTPDCLVDCGRGLALCGHALVMGAPFRWLTRAGPRPSTRTRTAGAPARAGALMTAPPAIFSERPSR